MSKRFALLATLVAATAAATGLLASTSSGAGKAQRTIGLVVPTDYGPYVEQGAQAAATALGDHLAIKEFSDTATQISAIQSLTAQHADAIAVDNQADDSEASQALEQAREAGIQTLSLEGRYAGSVWVNGSSPGQSARAYADALASQMKQRGQFVIVPCAPANPIVSTWVKLIKGYVQHRYPRMHRVGVVVGADGNGPAGSLLLRPLLKKHPHLRGLIFLCQDEAYNGPPQLIRLHKVGKIFSSGNAASYAPPVVDPWLTSVRNGTEELILPGDPAKLGYLTVWAADRLAAGQAFVPGDYHVGGPVGDVHYHGHHKELRLGRPLTITPANLAQYLG
jgi:ABC-type sugar transport system substrate-binding protein